MPRIDDIEDTPNPNAKKFVLKEPLTWGITRSYESAAQAAGDPLASAGGNGKNPTLPGMSLS